MWALPSCIGYIILNLSLHSGDWAAQIKFLPSTLALQNPEQGAAVHVISPSMTASYPAIGRLLDIIPAAR